MPNKVRDTARLHHKTVSNHREHVKKRSPRTVQQQIVNSVKVDMRVWSEAMRLARGDATRIVVNSPTEVLVVNQSKRKG